MCECVRCVCVCDVMCGCSLSLYESNMKPVWVDGVTCPGDALSLADCTFNEPLGYSNCSHRDLLAVRCGG